MLAWIFGDCRGVFNLEVLWLKKIISPIGSNWDNLLNLK